MEFYGTWILIFKVKNQIEFQIKRSKKYQKIIGFGGAITDTAAFNIYNLTKSATEKLITSYFGEWGIEYNLIRVPIGAVDFSLRGYSYDDQPNDTSLSNFSLAREDLEWKIPFIKTAMDQSLKPIKLFSSAWSSPAWMKTSNDFNKAGKSTWFIRFLWFTKFRYKIYFLPLLRKSISYIIEI